MKLLVIIIVIVAVVGAIFVPQFLYIVDETQVDDVYGNLGVEDILEGLQDVFLCQS